MTQQEKAFFDSLRYTRKEISVQDIVKFIEKGEQFLKFKENDTYNLIDFINGILISPDYQRVYKSTMKEESSIIESLLIGIPIPEVFLVANNKNQLRIRHVMDGQHRLNAIYRFLNNEFALKNLKIKEGYNSKKFSDLEIEDKIKILTSNLSILEFENFNTAEEEIELFKRYNTNTKKLESQEIEMVTYFSETNKYITQFINDLINDDSKIDIVRNKLCGIYNITPLRNNKQRNHQEVCVILNIIENGLIDVRNASDISKNFLQKKSYLFKNGKDENLNELINEFNLFNDFIIKTKEYLEYPFSPRILKDDEAKLNKFSIGLAIVYATLWHYFEINYSEEGFIEELLDFIYKTPIGNPNFKGSTTNLNEVKKYLFEINKVQNINYKFLEFKFK
ncbi:DUF262 domain-containing protein [Peribacillus frigoritolerans]|uniref:DUF262 domain-containing protein n=1 Tax=Peribacillus frigoritolerans TaxID=450367 RepID=UPI00222EB98E|nr:DUF262 domain-containing protein [Peribacillus frigoritolerans]UZD48705.1 DUF262 domain-containing protein [Peribacillus frigoritolerans]